MSWVLCVALLLICQVATPCVAYLQGSWLPVSYHTASANDIAAIVANLSAHGVKRLYVDVWNQGTVYFKSPTMQTLVGNTSSSNGRDILSWTLSAAKDKNMEVVAWFEYGLMAAYGSLSSSPFAEQAQKRGWVLGAYNNFYWMNPSNADVQSFVIGIIVDAVTAYAPLGLTGIQLDDHFGCPVSLGGTVSVMTSLMNKVHGAVKAKAGTTLLSLAPSTLSLSKDTYSVDWDAWGVSGLYDEVIPQLYRSDYASYQSIFQQTLASVSKATSTLFNAAGVRIDGSGSPTPCADVQNMIAYSKRYGRGNVIWYTHGLLELCPQLFSAAW